MADQSFGVKQLNLLGSGVPTIDSPSDINLNANNVAISTNLTVGNKLTVLSTGIVTAVSGIVSYFGDGSNLSGIGSYAGLTVKDEGSALATLATTLDFVGAGVTASGTGSTKTITIPGGGGGGVDSDAQENTSAGSNAGANLDGSGVRNTFFGYEAGNDVTSGDDNTLIGHNAGDKITDGYKNVAISAESLPSMQSGYSNIAVGWDAGRSVTGNKNVMIGDMAGRSLGSANDIIAIGYNALANVGTPTRCIGIGDGSVWLGGTDTYGIGQYSMARGTGTGCLGFGYYSGRNYDGGDYNIAIGHYSGYGKNSSPYSLGENNISIGYKSLYVIESGNRNIAIGNSAGELIKTGSGNVMIGMGASCPDDATNQIVLGNTSTSADNTFKVAATAGSYQGSNSSAWSTTSDRRIKKNIVDNTVGLDKINQLRVRNFEYRTEDEITDFDNVKASVVNKEGVQLGVIAQELEEVLPDTVNTMSTGIKTVNPENLTWYLINAVKELSAKNNALEERIKALES